MYTIAHKVISRSPSRLGPITDNGDVSEAPEKCLDLSSPFSSSPPVLQRLAMSLLCDKKYHQNVQYIYFYLLFLLLLKSLKALCKKFNRISNVAESEFLDW